MMLAATVDRGITHDDRQHLDRWANELGLTGREAIALITGK